MKKELFRISLDNAEIDSLMNDLHLLEVALRYDEASQFRICFSIAAARDGSWRSLDDSPFALWQKVTISAGFDDTLDPLLTGYITAIRPAFGSDPVSCGLEISGYDESIKLDREDVIKVWPDVKDSDIAGEIFGQYGFDTEIEDTGVVHEERISTIVQRETDMLFLKRLASRNGYECYIANSKGFFCKPRFDGQPQPTLAAQFGADMTVNRFTLESNALIPATAKSSQFERFTKEAVEVTARTGEQNILGGNTFGQICAPGQTSSGSMTLSKVPSTGAAEMAFLCDGIAANSEWFTKGEGEAAGNLYGHVLMPHAPVTIKGIGETYSGIYYVTDVTHRFTKDGYFQEFRVKRNGTGLRGDESF